MQWACQRTRCISNVCALGGAALGGAALGGAAQGGAAQGNRRAASRTRRPRAIASRRRTWRRWQPTYASGEPKVEEMAADLKLVALDAMRRSTRRSTQCGARRGAVVRTLPRRFVHVQVVHSLRTASGRSQMRALQGGAARGRAQRGTRSKCRPRTVGPPTIDPPSGTRRHQAQHSFWHVDST